MKKILTLLTVTMFAASLTGCCCCSRLCPWLNRGAYCGSPAPVFAPLAATAPAMAPACAPYQYAAQPYQYAAQPYQYAAQPYQYAAPLAATTANPCCPAPTPCATWDPCQGVVNYGYPAAAPAACAPPVCGPPACAPMAYTGDPGCGYMEPGCGQPYMGGMSYGPMMTGGCDTCGTGYSGPMVSPPGEVVMPSPVAD
ncbi:MAG: hypothetical protein WD669_11435 [Pirellulales bacterium]